jgi:DNA-binding NarL/FixJ family response regulator
MANKAVKVLLVDDHPTFREGLRSLISHIDGFRICGEAGGEPEAMGLLTTHSPDMMVVDLNLKEGSGLKLIKRARRANPSLNILVASMYEESIYGERAINAGANGYICKADPPELLLEAITQVSHGKPFYSRRLASRLTDGNRAADANDSTNPEDALSDRELQVFGLIGSGLSTREIADKLHLSPKTVDSHREHIKRKVGISDNVRLVHRAVEWVLSR